MSEYTANISERPVVKTGILASWPGAKAGRLPRGLSWREHEVARELGNGAQPAVLCADLTLGKPCASSRLPSQMERRLKEHPVSILKVALAPVNTAQPAMKLIVKEGQVALPYYTLKPHSAPTRSA